MIAQKYQTRRKNLQSITVEDANTAHLGLWLEKFLVTTYKKPDSESETQQKELIDAAQKTLIQEVHKISLIQTEQVEYKLFYDRYIKALEELDAKPREAKTKGRMIVGLGNESLWENSITIHRTYGVPFIPATALKGLCSSYAHRFLGSDWHKGSEAHCIMFGDTKSSGYVTFYDALPKPKTWTLEREVMTVHHPDYYGGNTAPSDWDSPTPIPFISATGTFSLAFTAPVDWQATVLGILEDALEQEGIGAKTSSGYGRLEFLESPQKQQLTALENQNRAVARASEASEAVCQRVLTLKAIQQYHQQMPMICSDLKRLELSLQKPLATQIIQILTERKLIKEFKGKGWLIDLQVLEQS